MEITGEHSATNHAGSPASRDGGGSEQRPWGTYVVLDDAPDCKVKRITVSPGQRLSYQSHAHRSEHWVIVSGQAIVTLDGIDNALVAGQSIQIGQGAAHRVSNPGAEPLVFVEVQLGDYFGEDDIVRYSDDYGRAPESGA
ncbi:MAG: phosphomannose isomerase type II C-terminal cupin domain [Actinomycetes bacterium]